jgi:hypothetical protein
MQIIQRLDAKEDSAKNGRTESQPAIETLRKPEPIDMAIDGHA